MEYREKRIIINYFEPMEFGNWLGDGDALEHDIITGRFEHVLRLFGFV
jgi:hypothetical protein